MSESRSFLIVGAGNELGREVARELAHRGSVLAIRRPREAEDAAMPVVDLSHAAAVRELMLGEVRARAVDTAIYIAPAPHAVAPGGRHAAELRLLLDALEQEARVRCVVMVGSAIIYRVESTGVTVADERQPLDFSASAPSYRRTLLELDVIASQRIGRGTARVAVLRLAGVLGAETLARRGRALRPLGFDPMVNVLSVRDAARSIALAAERRASGIFNVPGCDTLPLTELLHRMGRDAIPLPGALLRAAQRFERPPLAAELGVPRLDHGLILDGRAAEAAFGYAPQYAITPRSPS